MRVKFGIDPTSPHLHLGHVVPLLKLREYQQAGHDIVLVIGDYTATIGDPTGRDTARSPLTRAEVSANETTYLSQVSRVLDTTRIEVRHNSEWYDKLGLDGFLSLIAGQVTASRLMERDEFRQRISKGMPVHLSELMYPTMQAYDSCQLRADVEVGGEDQLLNMLLGRELQKKFCLTQQQVVTTPLLIGTDGKKKMSKSAGNCIPVDEDPLQMYSQVMAVSDDTMRAWCTALGYTPTEAHPMRAKKQLARHVVTLLRCKALADLADAQWAELHQHKQEAKPAEQE